MATSEDDDVNLYHFLVVKDDLKHDSLVRSMFLDSMCLIAQAITSTCLFYFYLFNFPTIVTTALCYARAPVYFNRVLVSSGVSLLLPRRLLSGKTLLSGLCLCLQASLHVQE